MASIRRCTGLAVIACSVSLSGCFDPESLCGNEVVTRAASPSAGVDAVVFHRDCGATTGFSTQVALVPAGGMPVGAGDVLVLKDRVALDLRWSSDAALVVSGIASAQVIHQSVVVGGIAVSYR